MGNPKTQVFKNSIRINQLPVSASRWQHLFCKFFLVTNHKTANNLATTREKISTDLET
jgi:hypothetical protein